MEYVQFFTIMATLLGGFGFIYKEIKSEVKEIRAECKTTSDRTDRLHETLIQLLRGGKK